MRPAIAFVCVGVSLILCGQWLGLIPDARQAELRVRARQCEAIGLNTAALVRRQNWTDLQSILNVIAERDSELLSIGIRTRAGVLRFETGGHAELWAKNKHVAKPGVKMHVPIMVNRRDWGQIEFCFRDINASMLATVLHHPITKLVGFFVLAGLFVYTLLVSRVMGAFDSTQVVPDRVQQALDTLAEGLLVLDEKEQIILANRAFADTTGLSQQHLSGKIASELSWVRPHDQQSITFPWVRAIREESPQVEQLLRYRLADGTQRIFSTNSAPIVATDGKQRGTLATFRDVTHIEEHRAELEEMLTVLRSSRDQIKRKNRELEILATQDALTGCLNRRAFFEKFDQYWQAAKKRRTPLACIMIDNDHFKQVNDTYGHQVGDDVLRAVSSLLRREFSEMGLVCRYGGEEFCVILPDHDVKRAQRLAEHVRKKIEVLRVESLTELRISASLGVSDLSYDAKDPQDLLNQADMCLYVAKRQGRNRVIVFQPQFAVMSSGAGDAADSPNSESPEGDELQPAATAQPIPFQAVTALVSALAYRDAETAEHSRRVADLCVATAKGLLDQNRTHLLEIAALLHDIGKIGVPDDILLKPDKLTPDEWHLMAQQNHIGREIVAETFNSDELSEIMRTHHAFFGGDAKKKHLPVGDAIPVGGRILAVCDSYDAIISNRPYRERRTHEEAVAELKRCAGTQFDPQIVDCFIQTIEDRRKLERNGSLTISKQIALQIAQQIERLAEAADHRDAESVNALASRLAKVARRNGVEPVAIAAEQLTIESTETAGGWVSVLEKTGELLELCRSAQKDFLPDAAPTDASADAKIKPAIGLIQLDIASPSF